MKKLFTVVKLQENNTQLITNLKIFNQTYLLWKFHVKYCFIIIDQLNSFSFYTNVLNMCIDYISSLSMFTWLYKFCNAINSKTECRTVQCIYKKKQSSLRTLPIIINTFIKIKSVNCYQTF